MSKLHAPNAFLMNDGYETCHTNHNQQFSAPVRNVIPSLLSKCLLDNLPNFRITLHDSLH